MTIQKSITDATKATMKNGAKDIATKVVPIVMAGVGTSVVGILNQEKVGK